MSGIQIRRAARGDLPSILRIERVSFTVDAWDAEIFRAYLEDCPELFFVATNGTTVAGYAIACIDGRGADLDSIAVHPRYRHHGVATALLQRTIASLRRRRVPVCRLVVRRTNRTAIALYRRFGFARTTTIPHYYPDGEAGWRMRRRIA